MKTKQGIQEAPYLLRVRRVSPLSLAKLGMVFYFLIGLLASSLILVAAYVLPQSTTGISQGLALGGIVGIPLVYGLIGFVGGWLAGLFLNVAVRIIGPIKFRIFLANEPEAKQ